MSDIGPYGVTQNPDAEMMTADAMVGERVSPVIGNAMVGSPAMSSTAPYKSPPAAPPRVLSEADRDALRRDNDEQRRLRELDVLARARAARGQCAGKDGTCQAGVLKGTDLCFFHTKQKERRESADPS